jgi:hypothetical protein
VGYGRNMQIFMDTPMYGKRVGLHIKRAHEMPGVQFNFPGTTS